MGKPSDFVKEKGAWLVPCFRSDFWAYFFFSQPHPSPMLVPRNTQPHYHNHRPWFLANIARFSLETKSRFFSYFSCLHLIFPSLFIVTNCQEGILWLYLCDPCQCRLEPLQARSPVVPRKGVNRSIVLPKLRKKRKKERVLSSFFPSLVYFFIFSLYNFISLVYLDLDRPWWRGSNPWSLDSTLAPILVIAKLFDFSSLWLLLSHLY